MAKKNKEEAVEIQEKAAEEVVEFVEEIAEEVIEQKDDFEKDVEVEIVNFYVKSYNGLKAICTGEKGEGFVTIKFFDGTLADFQPQNLRKI